MFVLESSFDETLQVVVDILKDNILDELSLIVFGIEEVLADKGQST